MLVNKIIRVSRVRFRIIRVLYRAFPGHSQISFWHRMCDPSTRTCLPTFPSDNHHTVRVYEFASCSCVAFGFISRMLVKSYVLHFDHLTYFA